MCAFHILRVIASPEGVIWGREENVNASGWGGIKRSVDEIEDVALGIEFGAEPIFISRSVSDNRLIQLIYRSFEFGSNKKAGC